LVLAGHLVRGLLGCLGVGVVGFRGFFFFFFGFWFSVGGIGWFLGGVGFWFWELWGGGGGVCWLGWGVFGVGGFLGGCVSGRMFPSLGSLYLDDEYSSVMVSQGLPERFL